MKTMDDNKIVELYLSRNENAINETRSKYGIRLRSLSYNIVKDLHIHKARLKQCFLELEVSFVSILKRRVIPYELKRIFRQIRTYKF